MSKSNSMSPLQQASCSLENILSTRQYAPSLGPRIMECTPLCLSLIEPYGFQIFQVPRIRPLSQPAVKMVPSSLRLTQITTTAFQFSSCNGVSSSVRTPAGGFCRPLNFSLLVFMTTGVRYSIHNHQIKCAKGPSRISDTELGSTVVVVFHFSDQSLL